MQYKIISTNCKAFWNNADGWTGLKGADTFSEDERKTFDLPIDGCWVPAGRVQVKTVSDLAFFLDFLPQKMRLCPTFTSVFNASDAGMTVCLVGLDEFGLPEESDDSNLVTEYGLLVNIKM